MWDIIGVHSDILGYDGGGGREEDRSGWSGSCAEETGYLIVEYREPSTLAVVCLTINILEYVLNW